MSSKNRNIVDDSRKDVESFSNIDAQTTTCDDSLDGLSFGYFKGPFADGKKVEYKN